MTPYSLPLRRWLYRAVHGRLPVQPAARPRRVTVARDPAYRAWVRTFPCCACGARRYVEAAHTGSDGGESLKASDYSCVPLCAWCHRCGPEAYHLVGKRAFEVLHMLDFRTIAAEKYREWRKRNV